MSVVPTPVDKTHHHEVLRKKTFLNLKQFGTRLHRPTKTKLVEYCTCFSLTTRSLSLSQQNNYRQQFLKQKFEIGGRRIIGLHLFESMQIFIVLLEQRRVLLAPHGHLASHHRLLSSESAQFLLALSEQSEQRALYTFSSLLPPDLAALLRSAFFFTGALFFARMALSRSAFHGFSDWISAVLILLKQTSTSFLLFRGPSSNGKREIKENLFFQYFLNFFSTRPRDKKSTDANDRLLSISARIV